jgi:hypothetical protein
MNLIVIIAFIDLLEKISFVNAKMMMDLKIVVEIILNLIINYFK